MTRLSILILVLWSCAPIDPTHPLDPETPFAEQSTAQVTGTLNLPRQFDSANLMSVLVHLEPLQSDRSVYETSVQANGVFTIEKVIPGQYRIHCEGPGVRSDAVFLQVTAGARLDIGSINLNPVVAVIRGTAYSTSGAPAVGAIVTADDELNSTITNVDGEFTLRVFAGQRIVTVSLLGHYTWASSQISVAPDEEYLIDDPIFVLPIPSTVRGSVRHRQFGTPTRAQAIQFELKPQPLMDSSAGFSRDTRVLRRDFDFSTDGQFQLNEVIPGAYTLTIRSLGYDAHTQPIIIDPDETLSLGLIELAHQSTGPNAVHFEGRLRSGLSGLTAVAVEIFIDDATERIPYLTVLTDTTGRFSVPASAAEYYHIFADVTGFPDIDKGPYHYDTTQGFVDANQEPADFNLSAIESP